MCPMTNMDTEPVKHTEPTKPRHEDALHPVEAPEDGTARETLPRSRRRKTKTEGVRFAHPSEAETAKILDFYQIRWQYEPRTFPIEWDKKGNPIQSFAPDFYLPEFDLYIELTTLNQKLVTKKNRKIRRLRELYPEIQIKIFYQRDFRSLLFKYGARDILKEE